MVAINMIASSATTWSAACWVMTRAWPISRAPVGARTSAFGSPKAPVTVANRYPLALSRVMICGSALTVSLRFPPESCIMMIAPRPCLGIAAATILAIPGRAQSRVSVLASTIR